MQPGAMMAPGGMAMGAPMAGGMGMPEKRCARCKGRGFTHDSNMKHDKPKRQRCFFCKDCPTCHGDGGVNVMAQRCRQCKGRGFQHNSSMNHDKPRGQRCFFCKDCPNCGGKGMC